MASTVCSSGVAMVIGPTPPATSVISEVRSTAEPKSTAPTLPGLYPASITTAPGLPSWPRISRGRPTAGDRRVPGEQQRAVLPYSSQAWTRVCSAILPSRSESMDSDRTRTPSVYSQLSL